MSNRWICQCGAVNAFVNGVCHNCKKEWLMETSASNMTTICITKDDQIESLSAMIKLWEERNADNVREIEVLKAKLEIAKRYFILIRIPPIEKAKTAYEYQALWERSRNDADEALKQITEVEG